MSVYITGLGSCVPARVVSNEELGRLLDVEASEIEAKTGIRERRWVEPGETNAKMASTAILRALEGAGITKGDLDALIVATLSPDAGFPGTGVFVQRELGLAPIPALDVRNQCSGFLYGLSIARAWILSDIYQAIALAGSEIHSTGLDKSPNGATITPLFGDGAGAVIVSRRCSPLEVIDVRLGADGTGIESLWCELPSSALHPNVDVSYFQEGRQFPKMNGRAVFKRAVETLEREISTLLEDHDLRPEDIVFVPHQANHHLNVMLSERLGIRHVVSTIEEYGNMTAASIPVTLERALQSGLLVPDAPVVMGAFGSGYTWATALLRVTTHP